MRKRLGYFEGRIILYVMLYRKKAMEAELLRSKTELMSLNNQLLEAVQKRLELSLELEAWRVRLQVMKESGEKKDAKAEVLIRSFEEGRKQKGRAGML